MSENIFFAVFFPAAAAGLVYFMKYVSAILQARVRLAQDEAYRESAAKSGAANAQTAALLTSFGSSLEQIHTRLGALEKLLKDVAEQSLNIACGQRLQT